MSSREVYRMMSAAELADHGATREPPTAQQWLSPVGVRATTDGIEWLPRDSLARGGLIVPADGLFEDFLALRDATSELVADFAVRHGVLGVGPPRWYQPGEYAHEPLRAWRAAAARAAALVGAAAQLRQGRLLDEGQRLPVLAAAWPDLEPQGAELLQVAQRTLEDDRVQLAWAVSTWLQEVGAQLVLTWPVGASAPELTIGGERPRGCLPAVIVQVALACSRAETTRVCDGCGALHAPRRQPKAGQRSFCQTCRDRGVPVKIANRDRRARSRMENGDQDG